MEPTTLRPLNLPRRMAPTDALFWYAETALPTLRPIIGGLYVLDRAPDPHGIKKGLEAALALVPRLCQRVMESPLHLGLPEWVDDHHFDFDYHFRHLSLPEPGTQRQLLDVTATLLATPLDRERPLWEAYWIGGLEHGRAAYFFKMHHSLVDGIGSLALLNGLTQRDRKGAIPHVVAPRRRRSGGGNLARLAGLAADNARESARLLASAASVPLQLVLHPAESADQLRRTARGLRGMLSDVSRPVVRDPLARAGSGLSRRLDVTAIPLDRLRRIKEPLGVTINDVVLAALAGTLGAYHRERRVRAQSLNCMVPMSLRGREERDTLGNRVGMFAIRLPVAEKRAEQRLEMIVRQTRVAKSDQRGAAMPFLLQTLNLIPGVAFRWLARQSLGRLSLVCTNIPGVQKPRYMAGARVEAIYPFASVVEGTPLVIALLSYAGRMDIGIDTDPEAIPDPHRIAELFEKALDEMESLSASRPHHAPAARFSRR